MRLKLPFASLATVLMTVLLAGTITWWTLLLLRPKPAVAPTAAVNESNTLSDLSLSGQLFGGIAITPAALAVPSNIQVLGVVADATRAAAVLTVDGRPRSVAIGEEISPGIQLIDVKADRIIIKRNGVAADLPAPKTSDPDILTAGTKAANMGSGSNTPPPGPLPPSGAAAAPPPPVAQPQPPPVPQQAVPNAINSAAGAVRGSIGQPGANVSPAINPATGQPYPPPVNQALNPAGGQAPTPQLNPANGQQPINPANGQPMPQQ